MQGEWSRNTGGNKWQMRTKQTWLIDLLSIVTDALDNVGRAHRKHFCWPLLVI